MEFDVGARLKELRAASRLTQRQLAERAGVPHGLIAMIENNKSSPSVASLRKVLDGLGLSMGEFFAAEPPPPAGKVFFAASELTELTEHLHAHASNGKGGGAISFRQVGEPRAHNLQILHERYAPGADTGTAMLEHASHEGGVVVRGTLEVTVGDQVRVLKPGDAYLFDSRLPHRFRNPGRTVCEVVSACTPPWL